jgi:glycine cleavage system H lipoate-binding protein
MVATLVLATFVVFILVDYYFQRRRPQPVVESRAERVAEEASIRPSVVSGFKLPANLSYHPGHTWAQKEARQTVRVGLDDFAARLVGQFDQIELPARGRWLRQGERAWAIVRGGHHFPMLSPIEGEVVDVNEEARRNPALLHEDPYGAGWLLAVHSPAMEGNLKNLLRGRLAQHWLEESVGVLQTRVSPGAEMRLQDGGSAIADLLSAVPEPDWERVVRELFLG